MAVAARAGGLRGSEAIEHVAPQLVRRGRVRSQDRFSLPVVPGDILFGPGDEQVVLILAVKVKRADSDAGITGDLLHRGLADAVIAKAFAGCFQNPLSLVVHRSSPVGPVYRTGPANSQSIVYGRLRTLQGPARQAGPTFSAQ